MGSGAELVQPTGDIESPADVEIMVQRFYRDVAQDELLGPIFNDVVNVDWSEHLPRLTQFWCRFLFGIRGYDGNPFAHHAAVHRQRRFTEADFTRWLELFTETVDLGWVGPNAERVKVLARNVARVHSKQLLGEPVAFGADATA